MLTVCVPRSGPPRPLSARELGLRCVRWWAGRSLGDAPRSAPGSGQEGHRQVKWGCREDGAPRGRQSRPGLSPLLQTPTSDRGVLTTNPTYGVLGRAHVSYTVVATNKDAQQPRAARPSLAGTRLPGARTCDGRGSDRLRWARGRERQPPGLTPSPLLALSVVLLCVGVHILLFGDSFPKCETRAAAGASPSAP